LANEALALRGIDAYYGDSHVLHGVDLVLGEARLLGLLGRNGAGKTTCMAVAMGILRPRGGQVTLFGEEVTGRPPEDISARGVALVPQGRRIFKSLTVRENLTVAARRPRGRRPPTLGLCRRDRCVSAPQGARFPDRGISLRRRAANACHRPCPHVESARFADG
jgi:branched-chain amino acid transport system ATP-binding protein